MGRAPRMKLSGGGRLCGVSSTEDTCFPSFGRIATGERTSGVMPPVLNKVAICMII